MTGLARDEAEMGREGAREVGGISEVGMTEAGEGMVKD